jgi:PAS domain S-box-containing protein
MYALSTKVLAALIGASEDAAFVKDREGRYLAINPAGMKMLSRDLSAIVGQTDAAFFASATAEKIMRRDREIMDLAAARTYEDVAVLNGRTHWYRTTKGPVRRSDGAVDGLWGISRDITDERVNRLDRERMLVEQDGHLDQLTAIEEKLADVERLASLGRLAAVVAHEIRNPLGVIRNAASLARKGTPYSDGPRLFDIIEEEVGRLNSLVEDLLDFVRPSSIAFLATQLAPFVKEVLDRQRFGQAPNGISMRLLGFDSSANVAIDQRLFTRALINILDNAFQAMETGGSLIVEISIDTGVTTVRVTDSGPGFSESARTHLFQPFFTTKATGTGLGLYVVKRIMEDHGGQATVESDGRGTIVSLSLPLV